jgi:hypothetical protein
MAPFLDLSFIVANRSLALPDSSVETLEAGAVADAHLGNKDHAFE